jgi:hypothetical protein
VDENERRVLRIFVPVLIWLGFVLVVDHGRWQHSIWNLLIDVLIGVVVIPAVAAVERASRREGYQRFVDRLSHQWPVYFWAGVIAVGIALLATGFVGQGVAVLVIPALVFGWAGLRKLTADPWK